MKPESILLVSDFAFPVKAGTERLVFGVAEWFSNNYGIQADILAPNWNNLPLQETVNGVNIYRFNTHDIQKPDPVKRVFGFVNAGLKLQKYDLYHGFYTMPPIVSSVALAKLRGAKSVITIFSTEQMEKNFSNPLKKLVILNSLRRADYITAYTWKIEKRLKEKYFPKQAITTTQGWVDAGFGGKPAKKGKGKIILFVGRITESKGVFVLLEAFAGIKERTSAKLVLIGPPYEKERVESEIKKLGLEKRVKLLGFVSQEELNGWYGKCDLIAVPALHADAFGFSLMEAMAFGKPVITTEGIGLKEFEPDGMIVKPGSVQELSDSILKMLSDKKFYEKSKKNAERLVKVFDKKKVMEKYLGVYRSAFE